MSIELTTLEPLPENMGFEELRREGYVAEFNVFAWTGLLGIARDYGWQPAGTQASKVAEEGMPPNETWPGFYTTNDGQIVTAEDAAALADSLEHALRDLPEIEVPDQQKPADQRRHPARDYQDFIREYRSVVEQQGIGDTASDVDVHPLGGFTHEEKQLYGWFIKLCRRGAFMIL
jgi:hypothetical protein